MANPNDIDFTEGNVFLQELGEELDVPGMALNEHGFTAIELEEIDVFLLWALQERRFIFCATPSQNLFKDGSLHRVSVLEKLLHLNHLMHGASRGSIGLQGDDITLSASWSPGEPFIAKDMAAELWLFIEDAMALREELKQWSAEGIPEAENESEISEGGGDDDVTHINA